jgi:sec-independent protein translocase protein TatC
MLVAIGIIFETPVIIMFLARLGVVTPKWLAARRKLWVVLAFVIAAIITPTFDPINQSIIAIPLIVLLELSILLAKLVYKKRGEPPATEA